MMYDWGPNIFDANDLTMDELSFGLVLFCRFKGPHAAIDI